MYKSLLPEFLPAKILPNSKNKSEVFGFGFFLGVHLKKPFNKGETVQEIRQNKH